MASMAAAAEQYFSTLNPLAAKIHRDIQDTRRAYEGLWSSFTEREKSEVINESMMKPEIAFLYTDLDSLELDTHEPPLRQGDLMSFFGREHGRRVVQDEGVAYRDEHSAPFLYQTGSQLNLCQLSDRRNKERDKSPPPVLSELALSHHKVVSELKSALRSHDALKKLPSPVRHEDVASPTRHEGAGFISKMMNKTFKGTSGREEERERLVTAAPAQVVASSDNYFRTSFASVVSPKADARPTRHSVTKSGSDLSEEQRGLLCSTSLDSSGTEYQSCEELARSGSGDTLTSTAPVTTGFDFLDNW